MPQYSYRHPETGEIKEIIQGMNENHAYFEDGVEWQRQFTVPQATINAKINPFSESQFSDKIAATKGTIGDVQDRSSEMSQRRAEQNGGVDPIRQKYFNDYAAKRKGKRHSLETKEKLSKTIEI